MFLSKLKVTGFRSIRNIDLDFQKGKNIIVGKNNSGKSNIIGALDIVLGENSPTYQKSENISELDFFSEKIIKEGKEILTTSNEISVLCILKREEDEELNYEEINKCYGFYKYLVPITNSDVISNLNTLFKIDPEALDNRVGKFYVNPKLKNQQTFKNEFDDKYQFAFAFMATKMEDRGIQKDMRFFYRENDKTPWTMSFSAPIRNELLQSAIIPSFRDPQNQLRPVAWSWFGKLMKYLTTSHGKDEKLKEAFDGVKTIADQIFDEARSKIQETSLNVAFPGSTIHFQFNEDFKTDVYKDSKIYIDDGIKTPISEKGSGIQSATIIGLFNFFTQKVNTKTSALLCVEEPELYLHPHARRVVSDRLDEFLDNGKNQVLLTTHSSEFIRTTDESLNIVLVRKIKGESKATPIKIHDSRYLLVDNNHNEIFFADKVIICEGNDSYLIRWIANNKFPGLLDAQNISIIAAGSKDRIGEFVRMIVYLGIECFILADFDFLLRDGDELANKYESGKHNSLASLNPSFFEQKSVFGSDGKKILIEISRIRQEIKTKQEKNFYLAKKVSELDNYKKYLTFIEKLRKHGIGILNGEIEDLSISHDFMSSNNKLKLDKVFEINRLLVSKDKKISDLFVLEEVEEFLNQVFNS